jgi:hypothetical protein
VKNRFVEDAVVAKKLVVVAFVVVLFVAVKALVEMSSATRDVIEATRDESFVE